MRTASSFARRKLACRSNFGGGHALLLFKQSRSAPWHECRESWPIPGLSIPSRDKRRWKWLVQTYLPIAALHLADELGSDEPGRIGSQIQVSLRLGKFTSRPSAIFVVSCFSVTSVRVTDDSDCLSLECDACPLSSRHCRSDAISANACLVRFRCSKSALREIMMKTRRTPAESPIRNPTPPVAPPGMATASLNPTPPRTIGRGMYCEFVIAIL